MPLHYKAYAGYNFSRTPVLKSQTNELQTSLALNSKAQSVTGKILKLIMAFVHSVQNEKATEICIYLFHL